jgi:hypothetical protein
MRFPASSKPLHNKDQVKLWPRDLGEMLRLHNTLNLFENNPHRPEFMVRFRVGCRSHVPALDIRKAGASAGDPDVRAM